MQDMKVLKVQLEASRMRRIAYTTFGVPTDVKDILRTVQHVRGLSLRQFIDNAVISLDSIDFEQVVIVEVPKDCNVSIAMSSNALRVITSIALDAHIDRNSALTWIIRHYLTILDNGCDCKTLGYMKMQEEVKKVCTCMSIVHERMKDIASMYIMDIPSIVYTLEACLNTMKNSKL